LFKQGVRIMEASDQAAGPRDGRGRFAPGQSGNPAGRRPGSRNHATLLRERLQDGDDELAVRVLMDRVRAGDGVAARFVADRLFPKPRDREIDLGLPPPEDGTPVAALLERALWLMARGELTIDEVTRISRLVTDCGRAAAVAPRVGRPVSAPADDLQMAGRSAAAARPIGRRRTPCARSTDTTGAAPRPCSAPRRTAGRRWGRRCRTRPPPERRRGRAGAGREVCGGGPAVA